MAAILRAVPVSPADQTIADLETRAGQAEDNVAELEAELVTARRSAAVLRAAADAAAAAGAA